MRTIAWVVLVVVAFLGFVIGMLEAGRDDV
jgi:hypothetical protein